MQLGMRCFQAVQMQASPCSCKLTFTYTFLQYTGVNLIFSGGFIGLLNRGMATDNIQFAIEAGKKVWLITEDIQRYDSSAVSLVLLIR